MGLKKKKNEDPIEFLNQIQELISNSDWYDISKTEAIGVKCNKSRKTCSEFMKEFPEGNIQQLADQLKWSRLQKSRGQKKIALIVANKAIQKVIVGAFAWHVVSQVTIQGYVNYHRKELEQEKKEREKEK